MTETRKKTERLDRIVEIRQIAVDQAEARVRETEAELRRFEARLTAEEGKIRRLLEVFAQPTGMTGFGLQQSEHGVEAARIRCRRIRQDIEKATGRLDERRQAWREALREKKTAEKLRERQLHRAVREEETLMQKTIDETASIRYVRDARS